MSYSALSSFRSSSIVRMPAIPLPTTTSFIFFMMRWWFRVVRIALRHGVRRRLVRCEPGVYGVDADSPGRRTGRPHSARQIDRKIVVLGKSVAVSVDPGGVRLLKKKIKNK